MIPAPTITTSAVCVMVPAMIVRPRTSTDALGRPPPDASLERRASATRLGASHFHGWSVTMRVAELWRYPVKSLAGEQLDAVDILRDGLPGDRVVQVYDARGRIVTSRTTPALLGLRGTTSATSEPLVDGAPWTAPEVAKAIEAIAGPGARPPCARRRGDRRLRQAPPPVRHDHLRSRHSRAGSGRPAPHRAGDGRTLGARFLRRPGRPRLGRRSRRAALATCLRVADRR